MDLISISNVILSFIFVLGLIVGLGVLLRYYKESSSNWLNIHNKSDKQRIKLIESMNIDIKTKLVIIAIDDNEYVLLIGDTFSNVISHNNDNAGKYHEHKLRRVIS